jgi:hypothetical protein
MGKGNNFIPLNFNFLPLNQTSRPWFGMASSRNGNVYACVVSGDIYRKDNEYI